MAQGRVIAIARSGGRDRLLVAGGRAGATHASTGRDGPARPVGVGDTAVMVASGPTMPTAVVRVDLRTGAVERIRESSTLSVDAGYLSQPRFVEFPTADERTAFAFHYPPTNPDAVAPDGELPPLLVISHGGPTSNTDQRLSLDVQFFTSRGFAVVDVDYGGSSRLRPGLPRSPAGQLGHRGPG